MPERDLALISQAVREAGEIAMHHFGESMASWDKPDNAGPVTEADLAVDAHCRALLLGARPDYGWLSEETEDDQSRLHAKRCFIIDPIDGTRSFMQGARDWGHAIAVVENDQVVAGAVYMPKHDALYTATRAGGAYCNGEAIQISARGDLDGAEVLCTKRHLESELWHRPPPLTRVYRSSLAYRLGLVARGRFDAMFTLRPTWEWDVAAGSLFVTEAGGHVCDSHGHAPRFNQATPRLAGLIAGPEPLCHEVLDHLSAPCSS